MLQKYGINSVKWQIENVWYCYVPVLQKQQIMHN